MPTTDDYDKSEEQRQNKLDAKITGMKRIIELIVFILAIILCMIAATYFMEQLYKIIIYGG